MELIKYLLYRLRYFYLSNSQICINHIGKEIVTVGSSNPFEQMDILYEIPLEVCNDYVKYKYRFNRNHGWLYQSDECWLIVNDIANQKQLTRNEENK